MSTLGEIAEEKTESKEYEYRQVTEGIIVRFINPASICFRYLILHYISASFQVHSVWGIFLVLNYSNLLMFVLSNNP